jgi:hypothetical protein
MYSWGAPLSGLKSKGVLQAMELTLLQWKPCCLSVYPQSSGSVALCLDDAAHIHTKPAITGRRFFTVMLNCSTNI